MGTISTKRLSIFSFHFIGPRSISSSSHSTGNMLVVVVYPDFCICRYFSEWSGAVTSIVITFLLFFVAAIIMSKLV